MSTEETKKPGKSIYLFPAAVALPITAATAFALIRVGPDIKKLLSILIKLVVKA